MQEALTKLPLSTLFIIWHQMNLNKTFLFPSDGTEMQTQNQCWEMDIIIIIIIIIILKCSSKHPYMDQHQMTLI
jgi:hypothetical protein